METGIGIILLLVASAAGFLMGGGWLACCLIWICGAGLFFVSGYFRRRRKKELEELTAYLMKLQDSPDPPKPGSCQDGAVGILQSEIYKFAIQQHEKAFQAAGEREYLARMLSDISHQLKTPLTSVTILSDLLKNPELPEEKRVEFAEKIDSQVERVNWLVKNLLTLSQLEAGVLKLKRERTSVRELLLEGCFPLEEAASQKGVALSVNVEEDMIFYCDRRWTTEAVANIVKNCMEHTKPGGSVRLSAEQNNFSTNIRIRDNGEGIKKEHLPHIFERFYKAENASPSSVGIGLSLARQIILLQNGTITVESEEGVGSCFLIKMYATVQDDSQWKDRSADLRSSE